MLEIEVKYAIPRWEEIETQLQQLGAQLSEGRDEADHYFNAPDRDFRQTDEAFRIRRVGSQNLLTYKGPRAQGPTKTRLEIEIPFADGDEPATDLARLLAQLGYRPVAVVRKKRRVYQLERGGFEIDVSLDDVEQLGRFAEVEIIADEARSEAAKHAVLQLASELGLTTVESRSYLQLLLERLRSPHA